ncbi:MAG: hypothetical protein HKN42_18010 [Granulosicoccus sp.]|nr:hypothetical protein [Granulosicoccus sp.]
MKTVTLKRGLALALDGAPEQTLHDGPPIRHVAWQRPANTLLQPEEAVTEGQPVRMGEGLFRDRHAPQVRHLAPASGIVSRIERDSRQQLTAIEIRCDASMACRVERFAPVDNAHQLRDLLQRSGLWTHLRQRPFETTPPPDATPAAIFITAMDTRPLAADPAVIIAARATEFGIGVDALAMLTAGPVYVCQEKASRLPDRQCKRVQVVAFSGTHPAGLAGVHIQQLYPCDREHPVWHIDCQDVIAIGTLLQSGTLDFGRVIALAGSNVRQPRLLKTRLGARLDDLLAGQLRDTKNTDPICGSVFAGKHRRWLDRFDRQVVSSGMLSMRSGTAVSFMSKSGAKSGTRSGTRSGAESGDIQLNGFAAEPRFDRISALSMPAVPLLRTLARLDFAAAESMGCLDLAAEDLELHAFVCPVGNDYPAALTRCHRQLTGHP